MDYKNSNEAIEFARERHKRYGTHFKVWAYIPKWGRSEWYFVNTAETPFYCPSRSKPRIIFEN